MNYNLTNKSILITGGGGFIGGELARQILKLGAREVRVVDRKDPSDWYQIHEGAKNLNVDLADYPNCEKVIKDIDVIFNLAADMGGMGFIENNKALCMLSVQVNTNLLKSALESDKIERYFFSSSACVYRSDLQDTENVIPLKEDDAYPASPEDGYGWEKLFSERMCRHFNEDFGLETRIARFHNVYGPFGTYAGGREKAPAALCRKVIEAKNSGNYEIDIWGDGNQTRSFMFIDDCVEGVLRITNSDINFPINLGSSFLVSINQLIDIIEEIAGVKVKRNYDLSAPLGVRGRNSDNTLIKQELGWEPAISLQQGLEKTYKWIHDQLNK
jgi:nucleoside-diphosphate-sugar epimerase